MPFIIIRREDPQYPLFLVKEFDGELLWDARKRYATFFENDEADKIAADINRISSTEVTVEGARGVAA